MEEIIGKIWECKMPTPERMIILPYKVVKLSDKDQEYIVYYLWEERIKAMKVLKRHWNDCFKQIC